MLWIDNTALTDFEMCPRLYYWRHRADLCEPRKLHHALAFGSCGHWAMEQAFTRLKGGASWDHCFTVLLAAFHDKWQELSPELDESIDDWRCPLAFDEAAPTWWHEMRSMVEMWPEVKATETRLAVPIPGTQWQYKCRIDLALGVDGTVVLIDHKFTSRPVSTAVIVYSNSPQLPMYAWAWSRRFGNTALSAAYNLLCAVKRRTMKGWGNISVNRAIAFANVSPPHLEMMEQRLCSVTSRIERMLDANDWPLHLSHCQGQWESCQFDILCQRVRFAPPSEAHIDEALSLGYTQREWDPFAL